MIEACDRLRPAACVGSCPRGRGMTDGDVCVVHDVCLLPTRAWDDRVTGRCFKARNTFAHAGVGWSTRSLVRSSRGRGMIGRGRSLQPGSGMTGSVIAWRIVRLGHRRRAIHHSARRASHLPAEVVAVPELTFRALPAAQSVMQRGNRQYIDNLCAAVGCTLCHPPESACIIRAHTDR